MKILHILNDGPPSAPDEVIEAQSRDNEVEIIDLSKNYESYDSVIERIFLCDRVISWQAEGAGGAE